MNTSVYFLSLSRISLLKKAHHNILVNTFRNVGYWNQDWKPGPYPKTEAERIAAAKKYNLHPKDYKPYPDNGDGLGDYPMLEVLSQDSRNQFEHYDMDEFKRNFGETYHPDFEMHTGDRLDVSRVQQIPWYEALAKFIVIVGSMIVIIKLDMKYNMYENPTIAPQLPKPGVKHYTFEPLD